MATSGFNTSRSLPSTSTPTRSLPFPLPYCLSRLHHQSWPLTLDRAYYETEALLAAFKHCPTHSPEVYHADRTMATIVMRYIGEMTVARQHRSACHCR